MIQLSMQFQHQLLNLQGCCQDESRGLYPDADISFYRTAAGAEIDFIVTRRGKTIALECKASSSPSVGKGTYCSLDAIRPDAAYVVAPIDEAYPLNDRITAIP